tara:strand:+ start:5388 stop:6230 length:843 start_codon:yes stop_codon:yes gene_type:complete
MDRPEEIPVSVYFQKTYQRSFGTFPLKGNELRDAMIIAAEVGYRSFDTAQMYENEKDTGAALKETGLPRDELFVTTKVGNPSFDDDRFIASVEQSLKDLQLDQVDVLLLHWPPADGNIAPSLKLLEKAWKQGLTRHIGVSNYTVKMMHDAKALIEAPIVTNQVEFHPLLDQHKLLAAAVETGIPLASYCSVARGKVFDYPLFAEIGQEYGKSPAQIVLRWILQMGVSINTMSTKRKNIQDNFNVMDFTLSTIDMARINALTATNYRIVNKDLVPHAPDFD